MNFKKQQTVAAGKANQTSYVGMFKKIKKRRKKSSNGTQFVFIIQLTLVFVFGLWQFRFHLKISRLHSQ